MITASDYQTIVCAIERADQLQIDADNELVNMQNVLSDTLTTAERRSSLRNEIENERLRISQFRSGPFFSLNNAVKSLQFHVSKHYGSVDSFLSTNAIKVSPFFAALSLAAGYKISASNVGQSCV